MSMRVFAFRLAAALFLVSPAAGLAPATVLADEYDAPAAVRDHHPRVERIERVRHPRVERIERVRTVERVRTQVVCYDYAGLPFDCRTPAPVAPQPAPQYYSSSSCGGCGSAVTYQQPVYQQPVVAPQYYRSGCGGCGAAVVVSPPAPRYYYSSSCGGCGRSYVAQPSYVAPQPAYEPACDDEQCAGYAQVQASPYYAGGGFRYRRLQ